MKSTTGFTATKGSYTATEDCYFCIYFFQSDANGYGAHVFYGNYNGQIILSAKAPGAHLSNITYVPSGVTICWNEHCGGSYIVYGCK